MDSLQPTSAALGVECSHACLFSRWPSDSGDLCLVATVLGRVCGDCKAQTSTIESHLHSTKHRTWPRTPPSSISTGWVERVSGHQGPWRPRWQFLGSSCRSEVRAHRLL